MLWEAWSNGLAGAITCWSIRVSPSTFTLTTLQQLAYLSVIYEKGINTLQTPHKRKSNSASLVDLQTNLDIFSEESTYSMND